MKKVMMTTAALMMATPMALAGAVDSSKVITFAAGTPAVAAQVNDTISALITAIDDNAERLAALETAATDNSVANTTYIMQSINSGIGVGGKNVEQDEFANVTNGSLKATLTLGENGMGTFAVEAGEDAEYEINTPSNNFINYAVDEQAETINITYTQTANTVVVTFPEDNTTFDVEFLVSGDGSMLVATTKEYDGDASYDDGSIGEFAFVELIIGTRTANPQ